MAVGLILVASCPSGTASNVVSYLAKVDVALAVSVTLTSTLFAFVMTPLWCQLLAGHYVPVDALGLCLSTLKAVVGPVLIGVLCNWKLPGLVRKVSLFGPAVSVVAVVLITAGIVSQNAQAVIDNAGKLVLAALLLHVLGFVLGYVVARLLGTNEDMGKHLGLDREWLARAIATTGNYGEMFERNVGAQSTLKLQRGLNQQWNKGGLMYAPPVR
jgi:BASS family bile acid:Na+ symporter